MDVGCGMLVIGILSKLLYPYVMSTGVLSFSSTNDNRKLQMKFDHYVGYVPPSFPTSFFSCPFRYR